jgi:hypothetical protein
VLRASEAASAPGVRLAVSDSGDSVVVVLSAASVWLWSRWGVSLCAFSADAAPMEWFKLPRLEGDGHLEGLLSSSSDDNAAVCTVSESNTPAGGRQWLLSWAMPCTAGGLATRPEHASHVAVSTLAVSFEHISDAAAAPYAAPAPLATATFASSGGLSSASVSAARRGSAATAAAGAHTPRTPQARAFSGWGDVSPQVSLTYPPPSSSVAANDSDPQDCEIMSPRPPSKLIRAVSNLLFSNKQATQAQDAATPKPAPTKRPSHSQGQGQGQGESGGAAQAVAPEAAAAAAAAAAPACACRHPREAACALAVLSMGRALLPAGAGTGAGAGAGVGAGAGASTSTGTGAGVQLAWDREGRCLAVLLAASTPQLHLLTPLNPLGGSSSGNVADFAVHSCVLHAASSGISGSRPGSCARVRSLAWLAVDKGSFSLFLALLLDDGRLLLVPKAMSPLAPSVTATLSGGKTAPLVFPVDAHAHSPASLSAHPSLPELYVALGFTVYTVRLQQGSATEWYKASLRILGTGTGTGTGERTGERAGAPAADRALARARAWGAPLLGLWGSLLSRDALGRLDALHEATNALIDATLWRAQAMLQAEVAEAEAEAGAEAGEAQAEEAESSADASVHALLDLFLAPERLAALGRNAIAPPALLSLGCRLAALLLRAGRLMGAFHCLRRTEDAYCAVRGSERLWHSELLEHARLLEGGGAGAPHAHAQLCGDQRPLQAQYLHVAAEARRAQQGQQQRRQQQGQQGQEGAGRDEDLNAVLSVIAARLGGGTLPVASPSSSSAPVFTSTATAREHHRQQRLLDEVRVMNECAGPRLGLGLGLGLAATPLKRPSSSSSSLSSPPRGGAHSHIEALNTARRLYSRRRYAHSRQVLSLAGNSHAWALASLYLHCEEFSECVVLAESIIAAISSPAIAAAASSSSSSPSAPPQAAQNATMQYWGPVYAVLTVARAIAAYLLRLDVLAPSPLAGPFLPPPASVRDLPSLTSGPVATFSWPGVHAVLAGDPAACGWTVRMCVRLLLWCGCAREAAEFVQALLRAQAQAPHLAGAPAAYSYSLFRHVPDAGDAWDASSSSSSPSSSFPSSSISCSSSSSPSSSSSSSSPSPPSSSAARELNELLLSVLTTFPAAVKESDFWAAAVAHFEQQAAAWNVPALLALFHLEPSRAAGAAAPPLPRLPAPQRLVFKALRRKLLPELRGALVRDLNAAAAGMVPVPGGAPGDVGADGSGGAHPADAFAAVPGAPLPGGVLAVLAARGPPAQDASVRARAATGRARGATAGLAYTSPYASCGDEQHERLIALFDKCGKYTRVALRVHAEADASFWPLADEMGVPIKTRTDGGESVETPAPLSELLSPVTSLLWFLVIRQNFL